MAYAIEPQTGDLVISGFGNGIGSDPYSGLTDLRSVNPISVPNEASIAFATKSVITAPNTGSETSTVTTGTNYLLIPSALNVESYQWVIFTAVGTSGLSTNTPYFLFYIGQSGANNEYQLYTTFEGASPVTISANSSVTWSTIIPGSPKYFQKSKAYNFMLDANGRVWSDIAVTGTGGGPTTSSWVYMGNSTDSTSNGNGLLIFTTVHNGTGGGSSGSSGGTPPTFDEWLFVWRNSQIDYTPISSAGSSSTILWVYGWNYQLTTGTTTGHTLYLNTIGTVNNPHPALVTPDSRVNFCDGNYIGNWYQNIPALGTTYTGFNPATAGTWTPQTITAVLPANEVGQCLAYVNSFLLIGTTSNIIYPWNISAASNTYSTPLILLPESNTTQIVTVGNNGYVFAGNRGNIYITNGSQANLYTKVPDHLSGAVEPLFSWGGATYNKNRLYFGVNANLQSGGSSTNYGGIWCIDINTGALFNAGQLSYGTYAGYTTAIAVIGSSGVNGASATAGYGLIAGWNDGTTPNYGIDISVATPYTGGQSIIVSDLIPTGTIYKKATPSQFEVKFSVPLKTGESAQILAGSSLNDYIKNSFTNVNTLSGDGTSSVLSGNFPTTLQSQQWLLVKVILTGISSSPTYDRITQIRVIGDSIKSNIPSQPYALQG